MATSVVRYYRYFSARNFCVVVRLRGVECQRYTWDRMYICSKCNGLVDQPGKRWWSRWRFCANGHVLYIRGLGPSVERSFWESFVRGLLRSIGFFGIFLLPALAPPEAPPRYKAAVAALGIGIIVSSFYLLMGLNLLRKAHVWARKAGPIQRLVTHASGRAYGFLAAFACQLVILIALLFAQ